MSCGHASSVNNPIQPSGGRAAAQNKSNTEGGHGAVGYVASNAVRYLVRDIWSRVTKVALHLLVDAAMLVAVQQLVALVAHTTQRGMRQCAGRREARRSTLGIAKRMLCTRFVLTASKLARSSTIMTLRLSSLFPLTRLLASLSDMPYFRLCKSLDACDVSAFWPEMKL